MKKTIMALGVLALPSVAIAHPGHGLDSFQAALMHPITGLDHVLVMLAVGVLASQLRGQLRWQLPLMFVFCMAIGTLLGMANLAFSGVEMAIALSVLVMGLVLLTHWRLPQRIGLAMVGGFALFHGMAHGLAFSQSQGGLIVFGLLLTTAILHAFGFFLGAQKRQFSTWLHTALAGFMVLVGTYLLVV